ncbi:MAG TPA: 50S ribosomal protein L18 [Methanobacterium sp.]|nr:50S ribosomal protein L18 [Methanobacterium sp.]
MAHGSRYKLAFKRRREGKTDYRARLNLIGLEKSRLVVRISNQHTTAQIINVNLNGDETIISAHSNELKKMGWLGSGKNTSAAYLTGFLVAKKALEAGITAAVLDIGLKSSTRGAKIFAALKGAVDAGLEVPHSDVILPADERIRGEHVAAYAESLSEEEVEKRFSQYIKNGLSPKDLPDHFESIKQKIEEGV